MKNIFLLLLILFWSNQITVAQASNHFFSLEGSINSGVGKIKLIPIGNDFFYPGNKGTYETNITNGSFTFKDSLKYPYAFRLRVDSNSAPVYISDIFFIDTGIQQIRCNINKPWETPEISNSVMGEMQTNYNKLLAVINQKAELIGREMDSLKIIYGNILPADKLQMLTQKEKGLTKLEQRLLLEYVKRNNSSYVALWNLVNKLSYGYEPLYDSIYILFSDSLKNSYTGKILFAKIKSGKETDIGKIFPARVLFNQNLKKVALPIKSNHKYLLVDFWFSHCNPCISQFAELNSLFKTYHVKGFDIAGISIDNKTNIKEWKNVIRKHHLSWVQYLDLNGKFANKLGITKYPSNFLLNEKGEIVAKDIEIFELVDFLKEHL